MGRAITRGVLCFLVALGGWLGHPLPVVAASPPVVERVEVRVMAETGLPLPLRERLAASVARVAERLLLGRSLEELAKDSPEEEQVITTVFGRILTGYRIEEVKINVARETLVVIWLLPEDPRVTAVRFSFHPRGVTEAAVAFLGEQFKAGEPLWAAMFSDLPLAAFPWAGPILIAGLKESLSSSFPGFQIGVELFPASTLQVEVELTPLGPVAEEIKVDLVPRNLPRLLVFRWADKAHSACEWLTGLPLAYLRRYQILFERRCTELLAAEELTRRFDLVWQVNLFPAVLTRGRVEVGAGHYSLGVNGELFLGSTTHLTLSLASGVRLGPEWEVQGTVSLGTEGGIHFAGTLFYDPDGKTTLGITKIFGGRESIWLRYRQGALSWGLEKEWANDGVFMAWVALTAQEGLTWRLTVNSQREYGLGIVFAF